jgi:hypothetical protein
VSQQRTQRRGHLCPPQRGADAVVDAMAESEMPLMCATELELPRGVVDVWIPIRRGKAKQDRRAGRDRGAAEAHRLHGPPAQHRLRRVQPHDFVNVRADERVIRCDCLASSRVTQ